jgi:hypothetical protein
MTTYFIFKPRHGYYCQYYSIDKSPFEINVDDYKVTSFDSLKEVYFEFTTSDLETYNHLKDCVIVRRTEVHNNLNLFKSLKLEKLRWAMSHLAEIQANMVFNDVVHSSFLDFVEIQNVITYAANNNIKHMGILDVTQFENEVADAALEFMLANSSYGRASGPLNRNQMHYILQNTIANWFPELCAYKTQMFGPYIVFKDRNDAMMFKLQYSGQLDVKILDFDEMPKKGDLTAIYSMLYSGQKQT